MWLKLFDLNNGVRMPTIGLGTAGFTQADVVNRAVDAALENGYRMIGEIALAKL